MFFNANGANNEIKQWSLNVKVTEPSLRAGDKVVFCNASGMTYPMKAYSDGGDIVVNVPNILLTIASPFLVHIYGRPETKTRINVGAWEKPEYYVYKDNDDWPSDNVIDTLVANGQIGSSSERISSESAYYIREFYPNEEAGGLNVIIVPGTFGVKESDLAVNIVWGQHEARYNLPAYTGGSFCVGDTSLMGDPDMSTAPGVDYCFAFDFDQNATLVAARVEGEHKFGVYSVREEVTPIDSKYYVKTINLADYTVTEEDTRQQTTLNTVFLTLLSQGGGTKESLLGNELWHDVDTDQPLRIVIDGSLMGAAAALEINGVSRVVELENNSTSMVAGKFTGLMSDNVISFTLILTRYSADNNNDGVWDDLSTYMTVIMG